MSLLVLCPSRGRPEALREAASTLVKTRVLGSTQLMAVLDFDDPRADEYVGSADSLYNWIFPVHEGGMVNALNAAAYDIIEDFPEITIVGFIGDDHRFRTKGWDQVITEKLDTPGYAYAYDGYWHKGEIPTQIFISKEIVKALGYFALPDCRHLYVDNAWRAMASRLGRLTYLPELLIEHMHPSVGKSEWDDQYKRVNSQDMYTHDRAAFEEWLNGPRFMQDVKRVRRALGYTVSTR